MSAVGYGALPIPIYDLFQFLGEVGVAEAFDFGGEGLWEEFGVDFFGDVRASVAEEAADDGHAQSVVEGEDRE